MTPDIIAFLWVGGCLVLVAICGARIVLKQGWIKKKDG